MQALVFPKGFLWGTATASHQVEGYNTHNDWWAFEQRPGALWSEGRSGAACDWWRNAEQDFDRMAQLGLNTHRLSLEWSRIEPEQGRFDPAAIARYREMLAGLRTRGMEPMVTLFHWSSPLWLARQGGWTNPAVVGYFRRFVRHVVQELGDLVTLWCTLNEPNVYTLMGHLIGIHPPGRRSPAAFLNAWRHQLRAHADAYRTIHALQHGARAGLVLSLQVLEAMDPADRISRLLAGVADYVFHQIAPRAVPEGRMPFPLSLWGSRYSPLIDSVDFWGVDYYMRRCISLRRGPTGRRMILDPMPGAEVSDACGNLGPYGEVYPEGMYRTLKRVAAWGRKPIYVTENGIPDADDDQRPRFLITHLAQVQRAIAEGVDVRGYYHWTLVDNFEWNAAWTWRFGLVALDEHTQARTPRPSAGLYAQIVRANAITPEMVRAYAPEVLPDVFPLP